MVQLWAALDPVSREDAGLQQVRLVLAATTDPLVGNRHEQHTLLPLCLPSCDSASKSTSRCQWQPAENEANCKYYNESKNGFRHACPQRFSGLLLDSWFLFA